MIKRFVAVSASLAVLAAAAPGLAAAQAANAGVDPSTINRIADEGFNRGQVMETVEHLSDQIGGRMTNSPAMRQAEAWTSGKFTEWGLKNVTKLPFDFGRGWWIEKSSARVIAPRPIEVREIPIAWTPSTKGVVSGEVVIAPMTSERDFARYKGKLAGKVVLMSFPAPPRDDLKAPFERYGDDDIAKLDAYRLGAFDPEAAARLVERRAFAKKRDDFLSQEGAVAFVTMSRSDGRIVHGDGGAGYKVGQTPLVPGFEFGAEDYRRIARLAKLGPVKVELESVVHYDDSDRNGYDILADIPGRDPKAGYVMAGAHLDSWVAGDGAADNGAGAAVVMEAARILSALGVKPKRTIRFALWAGEEQGLIGSNAYVDKFLAQRPPPPKGQEDTPAYFRGDAYPIKTLPGYGEMAGYFNLDNGSGKVRGIYAEGNFAAMPILKAWLAPFHSLGADAVVASPTGSTDHVGMVRVGLPAFQFIQDPLDYESRVHHTDLDTYDHLRAADLRQAAVIMATMLMDAAEAEQPLPRNVLPAQPRATDPFSYGDAPPVPGR
jgi:hypothetical protein